jgi:hypothetical protein
VAIAAGTSLIDHFTALKDPRQAWKVVYPLPEILLLVLCGTPRRRRGFRRNPPLGSGQSGVPAPLPAVRPWHPEPRHFE